MYICNKKKSEKCIFKTLCLVRFLQNMSEFCSTFSGKIEVLKPEFVFLLSNVIMLLMVLFDLFSTVPPASGTTGSSVSGGGALNGRGGGVASSASDMERGSWALSTVTRRLWMTLLRRKALVAVFVSFCWADSQTLLSQKISVYAHASRIWIADLCSI